MARGWESKSVESQQNERAGGQSKDRPSAEELEQQRKREGLELSRARIVRELENARTDVHRTALRNALTFLDGELRKL